MEQKLFKLNMLEYQQKQENERLLKVNLNQINCGSIKHIFRIVIFKGKSYA